VNNDGFRVIVILPQEVFTQYQEFLASEPVNVVFIDIEFIEQFSCNQDKSWSPVLVQLVFHITVFSASVT
jgi:hypothetical protein